MFSNYDLIKCTPWNEEVRHERKCAKCEDKEYKLGCCAHFMEKLLDQLYGVEKFDHLKVENALDEMCAYLDVKMRQGDVKIDRSK